MAMRIESMPLTTVLQIVNGWGSAPRSEAGEDQQPFPDLNSLGHGLGLPEQLRPALTHDGLTEVADQLHPVFAATDTGQRVERVDALLATTAVRAALDLVDSGPQLSWVVDEPRHAVLAAAALSLRQQLAEHNPDRLGVCAGRNCADAFIDASPAGHRRFCSVTCQNRARIAAFRRRRASTT